jgi:hypothetical protein
MPRLRAATGHTLTLPAQRVSVGESAANAVAIAPGHGLAAVHFHLQPWESGHFLEDAGSGLGTLVNGNAISWAPLKHGDVISAGSLLFTYEDEAQLPPPDFPAPVAVPRASEAPELKTTPVEALPPSWLPPEPPEPPPSTVRQAMRECEIEPVRDRTGPVVFGCLLLLIAVFAGLVWWLVP